MRAVNLDVQTSRSGATYPLRSMAICRRKNHNEEERSAPIVGIEDRYEVRTIIRSARNGHDICSTGILIYIQFLREGKKTVPLEVNV